MGHLLKLMGLPKSMVMVDCNKWYTRSLFFLERVLPGNVGQVSCSSLSLCNIGMLENENSHQGEAQERIVVTPSLKNKNIVCRLILENRRLRKQTVSIVLPISI